MKALVVAGIGTGIGKTFISAIITEALEADYWKPVQAGNPDFTDTDFVRQHISNSRSFFHPEAYRLTMPMSPHAAARIDGVQIEQGALQIPASPNSIVIEPAGGLMVPLNDTLLTIDLLKQWEMPVILVSRHYLGSINHTLLSVDVLRSRGIPILGIIFNGEENKATEEVILRYTGIRCIARVEEETEITKKTIIKYAEKFRQTLMDLL
jgi:dethiobiotin synthetase